jgi:hypothetical protein
MSNYAYMVIYIYISTRNAWALPRRRSVEGPHSQSNVVATLSAFHWGDQQRY